MSNSEKENNDKTREYDLNKSEDKIPNQDGKTEWTPETVGNLITLIDTLGEKYLVYKRDERQSSNRYLEIVSRHNKNLTLALGFILSIIIGIMSLLTYYNRVSGDALLFLVGTVTGYLITFIQKLVFGTTPPEPSEDEK